MPTQKRDCAAQGTSTRAIFQRRLRVAFVLAVLLVLGLARAALAQVSGLDNDLELVDPKVLRVCADPQNLPFSNEKGEGFENKLAELLARKLDKKLAYTWYPQSVGFVRNTLSAHRCDVIPGFPMGDDLVQSTNPYYRTGYALVFKGGGGFDDLDTLVDPRLKTKRIGIVAGTPPATYLALNGLLQQTKSYPLIVDTRVESSSLNMMNDVASGVIDIAILWGPMAGYYARQANPPMRVAVLAKEIGGPHLSYRIAMGVRPSDQNWKRVLNRILSQNRAEIDHLLIDFGVPLLDDNDRPITDDVRPK